jgi:dicarboxylate/amino acid:cation (Na+ or H+) symporter, DAACS family
VTEPATRRRVPLHTRILLGMLVGVVLGLVANYFASQSPAVAAQVKFIAEEIADPLGRVFLRMVIMVVLPLVFSALVLGVLELGDLRSLGRIGLRTLGYTVILSTASVAIGIGLVNYFQPGSSLAEEQRMALRERYSADAEDLQAKAQRAKPTKQVLIDLLPANPLQEMVGAVDGSSPGDGMLAVMVFALIIGVALTITRERTGPLIGVLEGMFDVSMTIIAGAMLIAPIGVACLVFAITATVGVDILVTLLRFVGTVLLGLAVQMFLVYSLMLLFVAKRSPWWFFSASREAIFTALGTSSSNATLPTALRVAKDDLKLRPEVSQFVLTVGSTANQNGTALFEGVVVLFLAQVFGVELTFMQQITVVMMSILAGIGTAGVPGGSLPMIVIVLSSVGVPGEGIGIILGVDRVLDMCRTTLNVAGDLVLATCVSTSEDRFSPRPAQ